MNDRKSVICEYPDCCKRVFYSKDHEFIAQKRACFCGLNKYYLCRDHKFPTKLICPKCVTGGTDIKHNYIYHTNTRLNWPHDVILKISDKIYLIHYVNTIMHSSGASKAIMQKCWLICI